MAKARVYVDAETQSHDPGPGDPDRPARIDSCLDALRDSSASFEFRGTTQASMDDLRRVHSSRYLEWLEEVAASGGSRVDADTAVGPKSMLIARRAAGTCMKAAQEAAGDGMPAFCLVRPPGHHAAADRAMGFCLINNIAVAAASLLSGELERVAIFDFDVHHGNGTQEIFWEDPRVLYISVHQWPWYPWRWGSLEEIGEGRGLGTTVNVPLPAMSGDATYLAALQRIVVPVIRQFGPETILVSAGFDAHRADPLSLMEVTTDGFGLMASILGQLAREICGGRLVLVLEGGYDLAALGQSVRAAAEAIGQGTALKEGSGLSEGWPYSSVAVDRIAAFHASRWNTS